MTILAGRIGEQAVAGYQILLNFMAVVFMVALGLSTATAVLTSEAVGRSDARDTVRASFTGLGLNTLVMGSLGLAALPFVQQLARAYTADVQLAALVAALIPLAAANMIPDGGQAVAAAALRARGDNWFPTGSHVLAYALVMPVLAFWLAEERQAGVSGLLQAIFWASVLSVSVLIGRMLWLARRHRAPASN
jgi:MATE family multidrug resistance protein